MQKEERKREDKVKKNERILEIRSTMRPQGPHAQKICISISIQRQSFA